MLFNSLEFALFFPVVVLVYAGLPSEWRRVMLLVASCIFYMAFVPAYILILAFVIFIDYVAALLIEGEAGWRRRLCLLASLVANVGVLAVFKYAGFLAANVNAIAEAFGHSLPVPALQIALPIGLSFHTFQAMSYTIEVYRGKCSAERNLVVYALYVMFFPQLVAGPIERPHSLLPQLRYMRALDASNVTDGLRLMVWGFFKKLAIADRLASFVNNVYADPTDYHGPALLVATIFFAFQIYCDFSGYSDIAIGAAKIIGIDLRTNFRRPYLSSSVSEFWTRWHVSLSSWFRDYVYIPLGGNRVPPVRWRWNVLLTFLLSGLWHGASWTFVVWGGLNGLFMVVGTASAPFRERLRSAVGINPDSHALRRLRIALTFSLICVSWVFFRAQSMSDALSILARFTDVTGDAFSELHLFGLKLTYGVGAICFLLLVETGLSSDDPNEWFYAAPTWLRWSAYYVVIVATLMFGAFTSSPFIYFQF